MKKLYLLPLLLLLGLCTGCTEQPQASKQDAIPFREGQYYAVAYLGYQQMEDLDDYARSIWTAISCQYTISPAEISIWSYPDTLVWS